MDIFAGARQRYWERWGYARLNRKNYEEALKSKYKPNNKSVEIIGMPSAVFTHLTSGDPTGALTQTIFDTTSRADSAQILLTNSTGGSKTIIAAWIRGKPVTRLSDASPARIGGRQSSGGKGMGGGAGGYLHDKYVDYESIAKNGERVFETGNNFVVTADQVNQLADYYWKLNKTKKHIYTLTLSGFQTWYEPGEWYTLQIGGAGQAEYIDSKVECFDVRLSLSAGGAPSTMVAFREVEENWKFDSNEVARQIAAGDFSRRTNQNVVTVASSTYPGYADYYCDESEDQNELNDAIEYANSIGGGVVRLTKGVFAISSSIVMLDDVVIQGEGPGSILKQMSTSISCIRASSTTNTVIRDLAFGVATGITESTGFPVHLIYTTNAVVMNNIVSRAAGNAIVADTCYNTSIINNFIDYDGATSTAACYGIYMLHSSTSLGNIIQGNTVQNIITSDQGIGILVQNNSQRFDCEITNNTITSVVGTASAYTSYGINVLANNVKINSNRVTECKNTGTTSKTYGIAIITASTNCQVANNYCYNNGADTGLANTNSQNFRDSGTDTQWAG